MKIMIFIFLSLFAFSCGRESKIKNAVKAKSTASTYGDGNHTILPLVVPLGDKELGEFDSGLSKIGFFAGGFAKMFMNLGASLGMGRMRLSLTQRIPEFPTEYVDSIKIKRVFFYIEPTNDSHRKVPWYLRMFNGRSDVDFRFVDKLGIKISTRSVENEDDWKPKFESVELDKIEIAPLRKILELETLQIPIEETDYGKELAIIRYNKNDAQKYLKGSDLNKMIILKSSKPAVLRKYLTTSPKFSSMIKSTHIMNDSVFVELNDVQDINSDFQSLVIKEKIILTQLGFDSLESCKQETCFDFKVTNQNLLPLLEGTNGLQLDTYVDAKQYPDSFKLKGFIEFELKLKLTF